MWAGAESCCHAQNLPPATWLHQGITTLFSTSRYTLVLTFKPTSKMWGGMMWPSLKTTPKTITITLGTSLLFVAIQICILSVLAMVLAIITWLGREHELYSGASSISLVEHCVTFRHYRKLLSLLGFVHNCPTTKTENRFSLNGNGIMSSFLGRQFYCSSL